MVLSARFAVRRALLVQCGLAVVVSLSALTAGAWLTWPSSVNALLYTGEVCCKATPSEVSTMVALMDLGNMLTPIPSSYLVDMYGRKPVIHSTAAMFIVASICAMTANSMWILYVGRVFAGMGKGIAFAVIPHFLAEVAEVDIRGALGTIFTAFVSFGISFDYIVGTLLPYQGLNITNLIIPAAFAVGFIFVPESPYFLVMKGKTSAALKHLGTYRQLPTSDESLIKELEEVKLTVETDMMNKARFIDVATTKSRRRALLITSLTALFQRLSGISPLLAFSTITLPETGGKPSREVYVIIFSILILIGNYTGIALVDKWGRKILFTMSTIACCIIDLVFAVYFTVKLLGVDVSGVIWLPYTALLLFGFCWGVGMSYIPSLWVGELFPTNVKTYASSIQSIMYAAGSLAGNKLFGEVSYLYGVHIMFYVFCACCFICSIFSIFFIFETKGKTFQEIQCELRNLSGENDDTNKYEMRNVNTQIIEDKANHI